MKKLLITISLCLWLAPAYALVGVDIKYGMTPTDNNLNQLLQDASIDEDKSFYGAEFFIEKNAERDALGIKIGFNKYGNIKFRDSLFLPPPFNTGQYYQSLENELYTIPITIYYKYKAFKHFHFILGSGATIIYSRWEQELNLPPYPGLNSGSSPHKNTKVFLHATLGAEWRVSNHIGIGLDLLYNSGSRIESGGLYRNIDGLSGDIAARWYF